MPAFSLPPTAILEESGDFVAGRERIREVKEVLRHQLMAVEKPVRPVSRIDSRILRHFPLPTLVNFTQDKKNSRTIMEVRSTDRVGFLAKIGLAMENHGVRLQGAKIATYGERVEDTFFIIDRNNNMVTDETKLDSLRNDITELLER